MENLLKEYRKEKRLKQKEVAEVIGVTQQAFSLFENGQAIPSLGTALKIAKFFNLNVEDIFMN